MKTLSIFTFLLACLALVSCKDKMQEDVIENAVPEAVIQVSSERDVLWHEVKVQVVASDPDGEVTSVELFANNQWIGSDIEAPYEFDWNTADFDDGTVTLKAIITDNEEMTHDAFLEVKVMNTLVDYDLYEGYLNINPAIQHFTFITSENRSILFFDYINSGNYQKTVKRPENFEDEIFDVHFGYVNNSVGKIITYSSCKAGRFSPVNPDRRGKSLGTAKLKFKDIPSHNHFTFNLYSGMPLQDDKTYNSFLYENLNLAYLYIRTETQGLYKLLKPLSAGNHEASLSATGFEMNAHTFKLNEKYTELNYNVYAHTGADADDPSVKLFNIDHNGGESFEVSFHTPKNVTDFDHFSSYLYFANQEKTYFNLFYYEIFDNPVKLNLDVTPISLRLSDYKFSFSSDPSDVLFTQSVVKKDGFNFSWEVYSADEDIEFPVIPSEVKQLNQKMTNSFLGFTNASSTFYIRDYDHLNSYEEFLNTYTGRTGKTLKQGGTYHAIAGHMFNLK